MHEPRLRRTHRDAGAPQSRLSYANVVATLALMIALGGGTAWAAHRYLITSTKQIKPSVRNALQGKDGTNGQNGATGATGATGAAGAAGAAGADLTSHTPLPSGQSESGFYAATGGDTSGDSAGTAITYGQPLAAPIANANIIWNQAGITSTHCPGYGHADPGYLCLYDNEQNSLAGPTAFYSSNGFSTPSTGAILYWEVSGSGNYVSGEYTVTAP